MAFRYQYYKADKDKIATGYDDCPFRCPQADKEWDERRRTFCDDCHHKKVKDKFYTDTQICFRERFEEELSRVEFDRYLEAVRNRRAWTGRPLT